MANYSSFGRFDERTTVLDLNDIIPHQSTGTKQMDRQTQIHRSICKLTENYKFSLINYVYCLALSDKVSEANLLSLSINNEFHRISPIMLNFVLIK